MKTRITIAIATLLAFVQCTERIDLDLNKNENQRLVVDGWITSIARPQTVRLTLTTDYFQNEAAPKATGATVSITDGSITFPLTENEPGLYQTAANVAGEPGKTYTLEIEYDGATYTASSFMRPAPPIDSINYAIDEDELDNPDEDNDGKLWHELFFYAQEPAGEGDHYYFKTYLNGDSKSDTLRNNGFVSDDGVDGSYIGGISYDYVEVADGDSVAAEMLTISKEAYEYFNAVMLETDWRGGIFDSPPANIPTNISNGALGFFSASAISQSHVIISL